jgi:hypothetical protein
MKPKSLPITIAAMAALLVAPAAASAASSVYAPDQDARTFSNDLGGWTAANTSSGACVEVVLCPAITNSYETSGGDGGGFIRTAIGSLTGVGGTSNGTWTSPTFVYKGADGADPDSIALTLSRRADVGQLLSVAGNSATFSVELVGVSRGADSVTVVEPRSLADSESWSKIRQVDVAPGQLAIGERYQLTITTTYRTGATVVPGGSADYDDVVLKAKTSAANGGGDGAGDGTAGNGGGNDNGGGSGGGNGGGQGDGGATGGAGGDGADALAGSGVAGKAATLTKAGRLQVKVRCARKAGGPCKMRIKGLVSKKGGALGKARKVRVKSGKSKVVALPVKPELRSTLDGKRKVLVRQRVKANGRSAKKVVRLKLRHG